MLAAKPAGMTKTFDLKDRTMKFAVDVADFCDTLPSNYRGWHVQKQLFRAGTGSAANYRAACRRKSRADFISKIGTAIEETDESDFWLEFSVASKLAKAESVKALRKEADELLAIFTTSRQTARDNLEASQAKNRDTFAYIVPD
jgi:four helix bundle protein